MTSAIPAEVLVIGLATAGALLTATWIGKEALAMEGQHWVMVAVMLMVGYVLGRLWTQPAQMLGLP
jgi:hypothetical protein